VEYRDFHSTGEALAKLSDGDPEVSHFVEEAAHAAAMHMAIEGTTHLMRGAGGTAGALAGPVGWALLAAHAIDLTYRKVTGSSIGYDLAPYDLGFEVELLRVENTAILNVIAGEYRDALASAHAHLAVAGMAGNLLQGQLLTEQERTEWEITFNEAMGDYYRAIERAKEAQRDYQRQRRSTVVDGPADISER
jgi:hypothetical protein